MPMILSCLAHVCLFRLVFSREVMAALVLENLVKDKKINTSTYLVHMLLKKPRYAAVQSPLTSVTERGRCVRSFLTVHY